MSAAKIPAASAIAFSDGVAIAAGSVPLPRLTVEEMVEQLNGRPLGELFKILKAVTAAAEKGSKSSTKKGTKKKSEESMTPEEKEKKDKRSAQLAKPRAWVTFVGEHARANGWPAFPAKKSTKDQMTDEKTYEMVEMPASMEKDGKHVFPDGKAFNHKHAMSLSTFYYGPKPKKAGEVHRCTKEGKALRETFEASYVPSSAAASAASSVVGTPDVSEDEEETEEPQVASAAASPAPKPKAKRWVARKDGKFTAWEHDGETLYRNKDNYVLRIAANGEEDFVGIYDSKKKTIDTSADMPENLPLIHTPN